MTAVAVVLALMAMSIRLANDPRNTIFVVAVALPFQAILAKNLPSFAGDLVQYLDEIALLAGLGRIVLQREPGRVWFQWREWTWAAVFLAIGLISAIVAGGVIPATALGTLQAGKLIGWLLVIRSIPWQREDGRRVVTAVAIASGFLLLSGIVGYLDPHLVVTYVLPDNMDLAGEILERGAAQGTSPFLLPFAHPGAYGWAAATTVLASTTLVIETRSRRALVGCAVGLACAILSLRRKPLIGIPVALLLAMGRMRRRQRVWLIGVAAAGVLVTTLVARDRLEVIIEDTVTNYLDADRDDQARFVLLYTSVDLATSHFPLGVGFGRFGGAASVKYYSEVYDQTGLSILPGFSGDPDEPSYMLDAYWPHLLGETGWLGAGAMLGFLLQLLRRLRATHRSAGDRDVRLVALFGFMVLVEALVESAASPLLEGGLEPLLLALPIGIAFCCADKMSSGDSRTRS